VIAALDARRGELYAAGWSAAALRASVQSAGPAEGLVPLLAEGVYTPAELAAALPAGGLVVGEGGPLLAEALIEASGGRLQVEAPPGCVPAARSVGRLGLAVLARGESLAAADLVPRYVRRAEAEVARTQQRFESSPARKPE
jgi:tRNA A37 threonylcarbamoyladenosine modification protein TsaB